MTNSTTTEIDITAEICPMTTVYVRLALDRAPVGAQIGITLMGEEPHRNVASALRMLGHAILADDALDADTARYRLVVRKSAASTKASPPSA